MQSAAVRYAAGRHTLDERGSLARAAACAVHVAAEDFDDPDAYGLTRDDIQEILLPAARAAVACSGIGDALDMIRERVTCRTCDARATTRAMDGQPVCSNTSQHAMQEGSTLFDAMLATHTSESGTAINKLTREDATPVDVSGELAQQVADAIGEHFSGDRKYWPKVMDTDWDDGSGRVIVWEHGVPDWTFLVSHGGRSDDSPLEYEPVSLPAGVWVGPINPCALRVLPRPC